jgi:hypothetical protein
MTEDQFRNAIRDQLEGRRDAFYVDKLLNPDNMGSWWVVYSSTEGFQPLIYAIKAETASDVEDIFMSEERNVDVDAESLVITRSELDYGDAT